MDHDWVAQLRVGAARICRRAQLWLVNLSVRGKIILGLTGLAALLLGIYTALPGKDMNLHVKVQHGFRSAEISLWVDQELVYSGKLKGTVKKRFGLIPDSVQGTASQVVPISPGQHIIRVRISSEQGVQEEAVTGSFASATDRDLTVSARHDGISLGLPEVPTAVRSSPGWLARYGATFLLTVAGSIVSTLTGFAIRELPEHLRVRQNPKAQSTSAGR